MSDNSNQKGNPPAPKRVSVLMVSDSEGADHKTWEDEIKALEALAAQDFDESFDVVIVESAANQNKPLPDTLTSAFPDLTVLYTDTKKSPAMKDFGIAHCDTEWIVIIDSDCEAAPNWLRVMMTAADKNPGYDVFAGRTNYGEENSILRVFNLLDRSYGDFGRDGPTNYIPNNGALFRTSVIKQFPFPDMPSPFCSPRVRSTNLLKAGHRFYFVHDAVLHHDWSRRFISDFRRQHGFGNLFAYDKQNAVTAVRALGGSMKNDIINIATKHRRYWRWYDWPLGIAMFFSVRPPEIYGIWECLQKKDGPQGTHFR